MIFNALGAIRSLWPLAIASLATVPARCRLHLIRGSETGAASFPLRGWGAAWSVSVGGVVRCAARPTVLRAGPALRLGPVRALRALTHLRARPARLLSDAQVASRRLAGWAIADHMRADLVTDALAAAIRTRGSSAGSIMRTDHGAQYTSRAFAEACRSAGVRRSMSSVGSSADNALAESFNATFKRETLQGRKSWPSEREARLDAFRWLHRYNTRRRHSRLGQRSPIAFENDFHPPTTLAPAA